MSDEIGLLRERLAAAADALKANAIQAGPMTLGHDDCPFAVADVLTPVLGFDPAAAFRGQYTSAFGARRALRRKNYATMAEAIHFAAKRHHWVSIPATAAQPGDLGLLNINGIESVALMHRSGFWVARSLKGFSAVRADYAHTAYALA